MLCASYCNICRAGIAYSVFCKVFTVNDFHIIYNRWDQFMFRASNEIMVRQSNMIFHFHKQSSLLFCCCDSNWHFRFVIHLMKSNFFWPQYWSNFLQSSNAGSCKLFRNKRWMFGILGFVEFYRCCVSVSLSLQCSRIYWKQMEINGWTLQIVAFIFQCFCWLTEFLNCSYLRLLSCAAEPSEFWVQSPEWKFGIWFHLTQGYQIDGDDQALEFPSRLPSSSLFHLTHQIFVFDQGDTSSNIFV